MTHATVSLRATVGDVRRLESLAINLGYTIGESGSGIHIRFPEGSAKDDGSRSSRRLYSIPEAIAYLEGVQEHLELTMSAEAKHDKK
jgi:hypothetical protein